MTIRPFFSGAYFSYKSKFALAQEMTLNPQQVKRISFIQIRYLQDTHFHDNREKWTLKSVWIERASIWVPFASAYWKFRLAARGSSLRVDCSVTGQMRRGHNTFMNTMNIVNLVNPLLINIRAIFISVVIEWKISPLALNSPSGDHALCLEILGPLTNNL